MCWQVHRPNTKSIWAHPSDWILSVFNSVWGACVWACKHTQSCRGVCARSVNLICVLLAAYMYSNSWSACTRTYNIVACVLVRVVAEHRDLFCQSRQCWKRFKATSTVDILSRLLPLLHRSHFVQYVLLEGKICAQAIVYLNACVRALSVFITFMYACM